MRRSIQLAGGVFVHVMFAIVLALVITQPAQQTSADPRHERLVWTAMRPGARSGGGGGPDQRKASPASLRRVVSENTPRFVLPRLPEVLGALELPGVPVAFAAADALGPGTDDGPRGGQGEGSRGPGSGLRDGPGAGADAGPYVDGAPGLTSPVIVWEKKPEYTVNAMHARVQGAVLLEATVLEDGSVGTVRVVESMNPSYGLDEKAVEAVRAWRFRPGTYQGRPVAVRVLVELVFTLR